jgi:TadE-like protein
VNSTTNRLLRRRRFGARRGVAVIELALVAFPLIFLLMGVVVVGLHLGRSVQITQVTRDTVSMYVRGVDFSKNPNKDLIVRLANGMGMTRTGGNGVMMLSRVTYIPDTMCVGVNPCNKNKHVITQRLYIGNQSLRSSNLGTPGGLDSLGNVSNYLQSASAVANFPYMQLSQGEYAYVVEGYFEAPSLTFPGFSNIKGVYSVAIF